MSASKRHTLPSRSAAVVDKPRELEMSSHSAHTTPINNEKNALATYGSVHVSKDEKFTSKPLGLSMINVENLKHAETERVYNKRDSRNSHGAHHMAASSRRSQTQRSSRKYRADEFELHDISREAGHTPPPSARSSNVAKFSDLVHDTDKKEGPINWWNLKVKMPDDNTMSILSPHRIPVPQTPPTPDYIVKTPDGLRISLLDVDIDDEKQLANLHIELDDAKKEYIHQLKQEQAMLAEKEKEEQKKKERLNNETGNSSSSDSDTEDYMTMNGGVDPNQMMAAMSQPASSGAYTDSHVKSRKRSKTPHEPSTPTVLTRDWEPLDANDPYSALDQYHSVNMTESFGPNIASLVTPQAASAGISNRTHEFYQQRMSLQDMRLYGVNNIHRSKSSNNNNNNNEGRLSHSKSEFRSRRSNQKRHSDLDILHHNKQKKAYYAYPNKNSKKRRKSRRKSRRNDKAGKLKRSHSVDDRPNNGKLKDRVTGSGAGKEEENKSSNNHYSAATTPALRSRSKRKKRKKKHAEKPRPQSAVFAPQKRKTQEIEPMSPMFLTQMASNSTAKRVRFKSQDLISNGEQHADDNSNVEKVSADTVPFPPPSHSFLDDDVLQIQVAQTGDTKINAKEQQITPIQTDTNVDLTMNTEAAELESEAQNVLDSETPMSISQPQPSEFKLKLQTFSPQDAEQVDDERQLGTVPIIAIPNLMLNATSSGASGKPSPIEDDDHDDEDEHEEQEVDEPLEEEDEDYEDEVDSQLDDEDDDEDDEDDDSGSSLHDSYMQHRMDTDSDEESFDEDRRYNPALQMQFPSMGDAPSINASSTMTQTYNVPLKSTASNNQAAALPKIEMPGGGNKLNLGIGVAAGLLVGADGNVSVHHSNNNHLASSPLIMENTEAMTNFFHQYIPKYYVNNPLLLSDTFEIHQYKDLKNVNLFIYKTLRSLQRDDANHPTHFRNIKMKADLQWKLKIDRIASCYMSDCLMTNVILMVSYPTDYDLSAFPATTSMPTFRDRDDNTANQAQSTPNTSRSKKGKKHLLGVIKSTQSYSMTAPSPSAAYAPSNRLAVSHGGTLAHSVTHTPRTSGVGSAALGLRPLSASNKRRPRPLSQISVNVSTPPNHRLPSQHSNNNSIDAAAAAADEQQQHTPKQTALSVRSIRTQSDNLNDNVNDKTTDEYYSNDSDAEQKEEIDERAAKEAEDHDNNNNNDDKHHDEQRLALIESTPPPSSSSCCCCCCSCCDIHNLRSSLILPRNACQQHLHSFVYHACYAAGDVLVFLVIYAVILAFAVCQRIYFPLLPYASHSDSKNENVDFYTIVITGRIILVSAILLCISRMSSFVSWLNQQSARMPLIATLFLDYFLQHRYVHLLLAWLGIMVPLLIHIVFVLFTPFTQPIHKKEFGVVDNTESDYDYHEQIYVYDLIRIALALLSMLGLVLSNCGGTYYTLYSVSLYSIERRRCMKLKSILCNKTFDYGHEKRRYKAWHIVSALVFFVVLYLDTDYVGVYYVLSIFLALLIVDRLYFVQCNKSKIVSSTDLNIIPIDHQFKLLFVNDNKQQFDMQPGDTFYVSASKWSFSRPAMFFSKNNYHSIGCIMRVHRNNTLSCNMERVKWNFNFLEQILDNEIAPIFRGSYRNSVYHRLIRNATDKHKNKCMRSGRRRIQYLLAVDEGIAYQIEYLTYLQAHNFSKMPYPTHIIFATSSKSLFNYICTNLQLLFVELEDLTIECKLLPSNINLIPNIGEMVDYYRTEKSKQQKKRKEQQQQQQQAKEEEETGNNDTSQITESEVLQEMEYDILHYLSIPHILYHHHLEAYYESHPHSKLSHALKEKYESERCESSHRKTNSTASRNSVISTLIKANSPLNKEKSDSNSKETAYDIELQQDIQIEMYYSGVPFVANVLHNVCKVCRIPYFTQNIY